ncbi:MAG TPA: SpoIIE family protein phosphatase [Spirochaetota bacterium]|nr:SpoIIE family protein phosphatase [Spirochaetota bacterium]HPG49352.1 SpoIIE family protein phosphatase [Spirochaetota bacterium]HPN11392.1 SpoIIE family protein phosphatase [Spirochaetota bacterium]HQL81725.1 SpoIIE family protein phosphatase [Spirochaetota bacterium]
MSDDRGRRGPDAEKEEGRMAGEAAPAGRRGVRFGIRLKFSLAIISIVVMIIVALTLFFIWNESSLLRTQVMQMVERETVHLANTAQQSIGVDELSLIEAINDLKKIKHIKYAFILDRDDLVIRYFDRRGTRDLEKPLSDRIDRKLADRTASAEILVKNVEDPTDTLGTVYDFSKTVMDKLDRKIGTVVIGLSDIIIRDEIAKLVKFIIPMSLLVLGIAIIASIIMATVTIRPIRALSQGAEIIGKGNLDHRIQINSRDELGQLAAEFNQMTAQIKEAKEKEIESRIMEEQIEMAKEIQEGLNPTNFYEKGGIQLKGYTKAARGVGGDYFDFIDIDDNRVGALISDVSGKGIPASLIMVMIRTVFTSYVTRGDVSCAGVVRAINDALAVDFAMDKFATLFFLIYNRETGELAFSNAGHGPLFCYRASMKSCTITKLDGVPIGIMEDSEYKQAQVRLNPGDMVVLFTDGVTEMRNEKAEEYGLHRLNKLIVENDFLNAEDFVRLLVHDLETFRGSEPPHDDTTVLVLKKIS